jgi:small subunit ribosomal protein S7
MKNLISFARKRTGHSMSEKLAAELMAAYKLEGGAYKKKEDTHRMAEANKALHISGFNINKRQKE